jgi:hypothetical protein
MRIDRFDPTAYAAALRQGHPRMGDVLQHRRWPLYRDQPVSQFVRDEVDCAAGDGDGLQVRPQLVADLDRGESVGPHLRDHAQRQAIRPTDQLPEPLINRQVIRGGSRLNHGGGLPQSLPHRPPKPFTAPSGAGIPNKLVHTNPSDRKDLRLCFVRTFCRAPPRRLLCRFAPLLLFGNALRCR